MPLPIVRPRVAHRFPIRFRQPPRSTTERIYTRTNRGLTELHTWRRVFITGFH